METKSIRQTVTFEAPARKVYDLIMDQKKHAAFTGYKVSMSKKINGKFDIFDGYCRGHNIELIDGEKIVQAWHFQEEGWPEDHYSICTFLFKPKGDKTQLTFTQSGVPEHKVEELKSGWKQFYWNPMKAYLKTGERHVTKTETNT
ncbi:MAG: SRPBCC family protein [Bacteroidota bacterium]|nr:SRPBCC family protein [Bacteroidota bacterium]